MQPRGAIGDDFQTPRLRRLFYRLEFAAVVAHRAPQVMGDLQALAQTWKTCACGCRTNPRQTWEDLWGDECMVRAGLGKWAQAHRLISATHENDTQAEWTRWILNAAVRALVNIDRGVTPSLSSYLDGSAWVPPPPPAPAFHAFDIERSITEAKAYLATLEAMKASSTADFPPLPYAAFAWLADYQVRLVDIPDLALTAEVGAVQIERDINALARIIGLTRRPAKKGRPRKGQSPEYRRATA